MATFVLVHGAFGSPAELAPVIPQLEALGHRAIAVDLPCTDPAATLDDYARTVVEAMAGYGVVGVTWPPVMPYVKLFTQTTRRSAFRRAAWKRWLPPMAERSPSPE